MTQRHLAEVLVAVAGVYLAASRLSELSLGLTMLLARGASPDGTDNLQIEMLSFAIPSVSIGAGSVLVLFRRQIAGALFGGESKGPISFTIQELQAALFSIVGVYVLAVALPVLVSGLLSLDPTESFTSLWPSYAGHMLQVGVGAFLFLGGSGLAGFWSLARKVGRGRGNGGAA